MTAAVGARVVALEAITRVVDDGAYSNVVLPALLARSTLDERDRAFATELAYGTIRTLRILDRAIEAASGRPVDRITPPARQALRLGAYQLHALRTPPHAAVSETVDLVGPKERGFVNAVLRRLARDGLGEPTEPGVDGIAARTGLHRWAVAELRRLLGNDREVESAARAFATRAPLSLRVNRCAASVEDVMAGLVASGLEPVRGAVDDDCLLLDGGDPSTLPGFAEGWFVVQDQASSFVVTALDPQPGERILDVCAAPGGKTFAAACAVGPDGLVVAADVHSPRASMIASQARRLGLRPKVLVQDALAAALRGPFDRVLVDAPCSGIGSARRRPELLWRVPKERVGPLAARQLAIADAAVDSLKPGGRLVYSVCTFPRAETDAVADELLAGRPGLEPVTTLGPDGPAARHRLWPHRHGTDGMFVAAFERTS